MTNQEPPGSYDLVMAITPISLDPSHAREILVLAADVPGIVERARATGKSVEDVNPTVVRFGQLIELYHTEPVLLDPIVPGLIEVLVSHVELPEPGDTSELSEKTQVALGFLKVLLTVRGYKTVIRFLPHEVFLLPKILAVLERPWPTNKVKPPFWNQSMTVLLAWFVLVCRNPFDFNTFAAAGEESYPTRIIRCMYRWRTIVQKYPCMVLAESLTRHDDNSALLVPAIDQALSKLAPDSEAPETEQDAELKLIGTIFKKGKRHELVRHGHRVIQGLEKPMALDSESRNVHVSTVKAVQRIALIYLRPKPAAWRYQCGVRSLEDNLTGKGGATTARVKPATQDDESILLVAEDERLVDAVVGCLMKGVTDEANDVRDQAAKGLGRITARLPIAKADAILTTLLSHHFGPNQSEAVWHGGCMTIAELAQRGCILPRHLPAVMDVVCRALVFDANACATAVNVRDAACYICWAFARGFEPALLKPVLERLPFSLVATALFDRSVNVRRAASAAFQENVGRCKTFPDGILLNTVIDFQSVANVDHCYNALCLDVASFGTYVWPMLEALVDVYALHWDEAMRVRTAIALRNLVEFAPFDSASRLVPQLTRRLLAPLSSIEARQGALLALGAVLRGLHESGLVDVSALPEVDHVKAALPAIRDEFNSAYKHGSMLMFHGLAAFIEAFCATHVNLSDEELDLWQGIVDRLLNDVQPTTRLAGQRAAKALFWYYTIDGSRQALFRPVLKKYFAMLRATDSSFTRSAVALALGVVPKVLLEMVSFDDDNTPLYDITVRRLIIAAEDPAYLTWYLARVDEITSVESVVSEVGIDRFDKQLLLQFLFKGIVDNTKTPGQGFVGLHIRAAAMSAFATFLIHWDAADVLTQEELDLCITRILQQACERTDNQRATAARYLKLLLESHGLQRIRHRELLYAIFTHHNKAFWQSPERAFGEIAPLLASEGYGKALQETYILIVVKKVSVHCSLAVTEILKARYRHQPDGANEFISHLLTIVREKKAEVPRVVYAFNQLFSTGCFQTLEEDPDSCSALRSYVKLLTTILQRPKTRLTSHLAAIEGLGTLLLVNQESATFVTALKTLNGLLGNETVCLREAAAHQLTAGLGVLDADDMQRLESVSTTLRDTDWSTEDLGTTQDQRRAVNDFVAELVAAHPADL